MTPYTPPRLVMPGDKLDAFELTIDGETREYWREGDQYMCRSQGLEGGTLTYTVTRFDFTAMSAAKREIERSTRMSNDTDTTPDHDCPQNSAVECVEPTCEGVECGQQETEEDEPPTRCGTLTDPENIERATVQYRENPFRVSAAKLREVLGVVPSMSGNDVLAEIAKLKKERDEARSEVLHPLARAVLDSIKADMEKNRRREDCDYPSDAWSRAGYPITSKGDEEVARLKRTADEGEAVIRDLARRIDEIRNERDTLKDELATLRARPVLTPEVVEEIAKLATHRAGWQRRKDEADAEIDDINRKLSAMCAPTVTGPRG